MACDVELVPVGPSGVIRIPDRFLHKGVALRGEYVIPHVTGNEICMIPAGEWKAMAESCLSGAKTAFHARNARRAFKPRVCLTIDRYGRFALPLNVRRRGGLGRNVTLELVSGSLYVKPEAAFESTLEFVRMTNAEMEVRFPEDTSSLLQKRTAQLRRGKGRLEMRIQHERISHLAAHELEAFVRDCFWKMGFRCAQTGRTSEPDGGIDMIACSGPLQPFPQMLAVQVKSHAGGRRRTAVKTVRDFFGAMQSHAVTGGVIITNSTYTEDARQFAQRHKQRLWLRDIDDLVKWTHNDFRSQRFSAEVSSVLQLRKGVAFSVKRGLVQRHWELE